MDPITAAINTITAVIKFQNDIFQALSPEQKAQYATQWLADIQAWRTMLDRVAALIPAPPK